MVRKWPKSGQKWPKLPQNRRNNWRGSPRKSQRIPKISEKRPKNAPTEIWKCTKKSKNGQKSAKNGKNFKKNRFSLQQLPKKGHFLKEMHPQKKIAFGEKKVQCFFRACGAIQLDPPPGAIEFLSSVLLSSAPYTWACSSRHLDPNLSPNGSLEVVFCPKLLSSIRIRNNFANFSKISLGSEPVFGKKGGGENVKNCFFDTF